MLKKTILKRKEIFVKKMTLFAFLLLGLTCTAFAMDKENKAGTSELLGESKSLKQVILEPKDKALPVSREESLGLDSSSLTGGAQRYPEGSTIVQTLLGENSDGKGGESGHGECMSKEDLLASLDAQKQKALYLVHMLTQEAEALKAHDVCSTAQRQKEAEVFAGLYNISQEILDAKKAYWLRTKKFEKEMTACNANNETEIGQKKYELEKQILEHGHKAEESRREAQAGATERTAKRSTQPCKISMVLSEQFRLIDLEKKYAIESAKRKTEREIKVLNSTLKVEMCTLQAEYEKDCSSLKGNIEEAEMKLRYQKEVARGPEGAARLPLVAAPAERGQEARHCHCPSDRVPSLPQLDSQQQNLEHTLTLLTSLLSGLTEGAPEAPQSASETATNGSDMEHLFSLALTSKKSPYTVL